MIKFSTPPFGPLKARPIAFKEFPTTYFWTWIVMDMFFGKTPLEGWEEIPSIEDDDFLILCSQLSPVAAGMSAQGQTGRYFVRTEDLHFARQYPVLLAHQAPVTVPPEEPKEILVGTHGVILDRDAIRLIALEHLGEAGEAIWAHLKQGTTLIPLRGTLQGHERSPQATQNEHAVKSALWEHALAAARELAILYWQVHQDMRQTALLSLPRPLPETTSVMRDQGIIIPQLIRSKGC